MTGAHAVCVRVALRGPTEEPTPKTMHFFVGHEFGVSGYGDDRRPHRCAWACPRGILSLTTGMRLRAATGTVLIWRSGTSSSSSLSVRRAEANRGGAEADRGAPSQSRAH